MDRSTPTTPDDGKQATVAAPTGNVIVPIGLILGATVVLMLVGWDLVTGKTDDGQSVIHQHNAINWLTAACLIGAGYLAAAIGIRHRRRPGTDQSTWVLFPVGAGFLFGGCDELFEIHERFGSWVLGAYLAGACLSLIWLLPVLARHRVPLLTFLAGMVGFAVAFACEAFCQTAADAGPPLSYVAYVEEVGEFTACLLFFLSMMTLYASKPPR